MIEAAESSAPKTSVRSQVSVTAIVLTCVIVSSAVALLRAPFTLDDAFITFRYARNFAAGYPLGTWNIGEAPVEGFSSLLWTLILAAAIKLGLSPFFVSKVVGYLSALAMPCITLAASRATRTHDHLVRDREARIDPTGLACASVLLSLYIPLFYYSVTGMEATFFALLVLLVLLIPVLAPGPFRGLCAALICVALVLTRPEGVLVAGFVSGYTLLRAGRGWSRSWALIGVSATTIAFLALTAFRLHQFGEIVPNTYFAKAVGGSSIHRAYLGARYLAQSLLLVAPAVAALIYAVVRGARKISLKSPIVMLLLLASLYTIYVVKVGGDPNAAFPLRRHFVHSIAVFALFAGTLVAMTATDARRAFRFSLVTALVTAGWIAALWGRPFLAEGVTFASHSGQFRLAPPAKTLAWYRRYSTPQTTTALNIAGQQPWFLPGRYIDMLALNDAHIAKYGQVDTNSKMQDSKTDMNYVLARRPDIIIGFLKAASLLANRCPAEMHGDRSKMMHDMVSNPIFQNEYVLIANGPYDGDSQAVFFRESYLKGLDAPELVGIPVSETVLAGPNCQ